MTVLHLCALFSSRGRSAVCCRKRATWGFSSRCCAHLQEATNLHVFGTFACQKYGLLLLLLLRAPADVTGFAQRFVHFVTTYD
jgi:hypothetical protein